MIKPDCKIIAVDNDIQEIERLNRVCWKSINHLLFNIISLILC